MARSADAHSHLFSGGYRGSFAGRPGVVVDDAEGANSCRGAMSPSAVAVLASGEGSGVTHELAVTSLPLAGVLADTIYAAA